jgi:hypothetical protein
MCHVWYQIQLLVSIKKIQLLVNVEGGGGNGLHAVTVRFKWMVVIDFI